MKPSTTIWIACIAWLSTVALALYLLDYFKPLPPPVGAHVPVLVAPQVKKVAMTTIKPPQVRVYGLDAQARLGIKTNPTAHVLTASLCQTSLNPQTIVTVIDEVTGETETTVKREPLPWLGFKRSGYFGVGYGYKVGVGQAYRITASQNFVQSKAFDFGINGTLDSDGQAFVGGHVIRRF